MSQIDKNVKILVVEDNWGNQAVAIMLLSKLGIQNTSLAENGKDCLDKILSKKFDLILLDCQMPIMDGYEATTRIRTLGIEIPITAMTANAMHGDRGKCLAVGMNDFVSKPVSLENLREISLDSPLELLTK